MIRFDLMKEKPALDIPTLNFIWDELCRSNLCNPCKNDKQRNEYFTKGRLMNRLQELANEQIKE